MLATFRPYMPTEHGIEGNQPVAVVVSLDHHTLGGVRTTVNLTLWEALELRKKLDELFDA